MARRPKIKVVLAYDPGRQGPECLMDAYARLVSVHKRSFRINAAPAKNDNAASDSTGGRAYGNESSSAVCPRVGGTAGH